MKVEEPTRIGFLDTWPGILMSILAFLLFGYWMFIQLIENDIPYDNNSAIIGVNPNSIPYVLLIALGIGVGSFIIRVLWYTYDEVKRK